MQKKFESTETLITKKNQLLKTLKKVAFAMQLLGKNYLTNDELFDLLSESEAKLIKYNSALERESSYSEKWTFIHNNIQEYLVALILSELTFEKILDIITIPETKNIVNQNWLNVLSFFTSLKENPDVQFKLFEWLSKNESELIIKFEDERISKDLRNRVFQNIFNDYKRHDIWIRSNKFSIEELAKFGSTQENIEFILGEIQNKKSSKNNLINSIKIIQYFDINSTNFERKVILKVLLKILENERDPDIIYSILNSFKNNQLYLEGTLEKTYHLIRDRDNEYIRSAMYSLIEHVGKCNDYIEYLLKGFYDKKKNYGDRGTTRFANEDLNLIDCLSKIDEPKAIEKFSEFLVKSEIRRNINYSRYIENLLNNAKNTFFESDIILNSIYKLFLHTISKYIYEVNSLFKKFFSETETQLIIFDNITKNGSEMNPQHFSIAIATILNDETLSKLIVEYNSGKIDKNILEHIFFDLKDAIEIQATFKKRIEEETSFRFPKYKPPIDYDRLRKKKLEEDIHLLLNHEELKNAVFNFFDEIKSEEIEYDNFMEIINSDKRWEEETEYFQGASLRLIQDSVDSGKKITKKDINEWFQNDDSISFYCYWQIYQLLVREKEIFFNEEDEIKICEWTQTMAKEIEFKNYSNQFTRGRA